MRSGQKAQLKKRHRSNTRRQKQAAATLAPFDYQEWAGFLRARYYLTHRNNYAPAVFEVAAFFLDDLLATIVQQNFEAFSGDQRATVNLNQAMQATLVTSDDRDWRYFMLLMPVLFDLQNFLVKESHVNDRFVVATTPFDPNFWRMIIRTVLAVNCFKWQGEDVAKLMATSDTIDQLQHAFLIEAGDDDHFDLAKIAATFAPLTPKVTQLEATETVTRVTLTDAELADEMAYANRRIGEYQAASVAGVVNGNVVAFLTAVHRGLATHYGLTHSDWTAAALADNIQQHLLADWQPVWESLDGLGGELLNYITFLHNKKALPQAKKLTKALADAPKVIDTLTVNYLLAQLSDDDITAILGQ